VWSGPAWRKEEKGGGTPARDSDRGERAYKAGTALKVGGRLTFSFAPMGFSRTWIPATCYPTFCFPTLSFFTQLVMNWFRFILGLRECIAAEIDAECCCFPQNLTAK